jgi:hypothetical protein
MLMCNPSFSAHLSARGLKTRTNPGLFGTVKLHLLTAV